MERTAKQVILGFLLATADIEIVGYSCEPIPTAFDPDDEMDGDTVMNISIERQITEGKFFCTPMRVTFHMMEMREMPDDQFLRNMKSFHQALIKFRERPLQGFDTVVASYEGISTIAETMFAEHNKPSKPKSH